MLREMWLGLKRFWGLRWLIKGPILVVTVLVILIIVAGIVGQEEEKEPETVAEVTVTPQPTETPVPPAPTDTPLQAEPTDTPAPTAAPVTYEIAEREDVSFGAVVRIVYRVRVSGPLTEDDLRRIAQEIIDDETSQQDVNAIGFFFYLPGTDTTGVYTAGRAHWAPDGDWSSADTVQAGDYSRHELGLIALGNPLASVDTDEPVPVEDETLTVADAKDQFHFDLETVSIMCQRAPGERFALTLEFCKAGLEAAPFYFNPEYVEEFGNPVPACLEETRLRIIDSLEDAAVIAGKALNGDEKALDLMTRFFDDPGAFFAELHAWIDAACPPP